MRLILYEYPFNERIRTLLRLEDLFERCTFFLTQEDPRSTTSRWTTLFEIAEVAGRTDLKADLMKELERQRQTLAPFRGNPGIEQEALEAVLGEIEQDARGSADAGQDRVKHLADNEWLASIRSRTIIPGGTCKFDLPLVFRAGSNCRWSSAARTSREWVMPMLALATRPPSCCVSRANRDRRRRSWAMQGSYQQMLSGRTYQLMQVARRRRCWVIPRSEREQVHAVGAFHGAGRRSCARVRSMSTCRFTSRCAVSDQSLNPAGRLISLVRQFSVTSDSMVTVVKCPTCGKEVRWLPENTLSSVLLRSAASRSTWAPGQPKSTRSRAIRRKRRPMTIRAAA